MFLREGDLDHLNLSLGAWWVASDMTLPPDLGRNLRDGFSPDYRSITGSLGLVYRVNRVVALCPRLCSRCEGVGGAGSREGAA